MYMEVFRRYLRVVGFMSVKFRVRESLGNIDLGVIVVEVLGVGRNF